MASRGVLGNVLLAALGGASGGLAGVAEQDKQRQATRHGRAALALQARAANLEPYTGTGPAPAGSVALPDATGRGDATFSPMPFDSTEIGQRMAATVKQAQDEASRKATVYAENYEKAKAGDSTALGAIAALGEDYLRHVDPLKTTSGATPQYEKMRDRIAELQRTGMSLDQASTQARTEFGEQNTPPPGKQLQTSITPTGPAYTEYDPRAGTITPVDSGDARPKIQAVAPLALSNFGRFKAAVPSLRAQHKVALEFENDPDPNKWTLFNEFERAFYGQDKGMSAVQALRNAAATVDLNKNNKKLARYLRAIERFAFEDGTIQLRGGTDARVALDNEISGIGPGMGEDAIRDTQEGRQIRIDGYASIIPVIDKMLQGAAGTGFNPGVPGSGKPKSFRDVVK